MTNEEREVVELVRHVVTSGDRADWLTLGQYHYWKLLTIIDSQAAEIERLTPKKHAEMLSEAFAALQGGEQL